MTDGGIETTLIFMEGQDLTYFAAFHLLRTAQGESVLRKYFRTYGELAAKFRAGLVLEHGHLEGEPGLAAKLGYSADALADVNRRAIALIEEVRNEFEAPETPIVISGWVGPVVTATSRTLPLLRCACRCSTRHALRPVNPRFDRHPSPLRGYTQAIRLLDPGRRAPRWRKP